MAITESAGEDTNEKPPFGSIDIEYHVDRETLEAMKDAYAEEVEHGYESSFTAFLMENTILDDETVRVDPVDVPEP